MSEETKSEIQLRCLSFSKSAKVISVCLDLDLFAEANSFEESRDKLFDAVILYVQHAIGNNEISKLIPRRAPLKYFALYYGNLLLSVIGKKLKDLIENYYNFRRYPFPVHLNPAEGTPLFG